MRAIFLFALVALLPMAASVADYCPNYEGAEFGKCTEANGCQTRGDRGCVAKTASVAVNCPALEGAEFDKCTEANGCVKTLMGGCVPMRLTTVAVNCPALEGARLDECTKAIGCVKTDMGGCLPMTASDDRNGDGVNSGDDRNGDGVNSGDDRNGDGGNSGDDRNGDGSGAHGCWEDQDCEDKDCEDKDCEGGFFCNRSDGPETKGNCEFRNAWDIRNCPSNANYDNCWADSAYGCGQQEALRQEKYDAVMSTPIGLDGDQKGRYNAYLRNCCTAVGQPCKIHGMDGGKCMTSTDHYSGFMCQEGDDWAGAWAACPSWAVYATTVCATGPDSCTRLPTDVEGMAMCVEYSTVPCSGNALAQRELGPSCGGTAYPQGTCGHHRWGSDADGHSKCAGRQPFEGGNPLLFSTYADDPEACCMAGIGGGGCDTSADCPYGRQCHCPQSHVRRRLLFSREKKCSCAA